MRMTTSYSFFVVFILTLLMLTTSEKTVFNVLDYGAVGDGHNDDTTAFAEAWKETCDSSSTRSTMRVPLGKTFFIQPLKFEGPCKPKNIIVEIDGYLVPPSNPLDWNCENHKCEKWIYFHRVDGLMVQGHGTVDGRGRIWWNKHRQNRPTAFEISNSNDVHLSGLKFKDSPRMHVVLNSLTSLFVSNVTIEAPRNSPNTDGIHVSGCINSAVDRCNIGTGDDCISIVDGTKSLVATNIICGPGHGISIGSLGKHGANDKVEDITVTDVVFIGATNGVRIKTWQGGKGYARNILFERILSHNTENPIIIDQFYCDHEHCVNSNSAVQVSNVTYRQVLGTSRKKKAAVSIRCSEAVPCRDIVVEDIHIIAKEGKTSYECSNVRGRARGEKFPSMSCLDN